jgi:putative membrane protein
MGFIAHWAITALALVVADWALDGVRISSGLVLVVSALVLGLVNALVRPLLVLLTLPFTILTLGLFYLVVNGIAFGLAAALVPGFDARGLGSAVAGALIVGLVSWLLGGVARHRSRPA